MNIRLQNVHFSIGMLTIALVCIAFVESRALAQQTDSVKPNEPTGSVEEDFLANVRQLTFDGKRAGEGYFNHDGSLMVFQSERRADNPFYQIYLLDFETGDVEPISPGHGKTTCAWVHPDDNRVLFASTQNDPDARAKQKQEIEFRESGEQRRYAWDYDPSYELIEFDRAKNTYRQLTNAEGYDAEGSYSPDGKLIAFASNRNAFSKPLTNEAREKFIHDPAHAMEIFIMNSDGSDAKQLTDEPGYDGGPFFSPDGKRICWRRFSENGMIAEIYSMNIDGSDQRQLTKMGAMSWAPFYHPSGKYLIFTTNKHGFANFELYLVDAAGKSTPVRVTETDGFDALASFTPDGNKLTWTSQRNARKESQIYLADWNHEAALKLLAVAPKRDDGGDAVTGSLNQNGSAENSQRELDQDPDAVTSGTASAKLADPDFDPRDIMRHVDYLCRPELAGRMTGSVGEKKATSYVAAYLDYLGLEPAGDNGSWFQKFEFPNGAELGQNNRCGFAIGEKSATELKLETDWRPLSFSGNVTIEPKSVVFAGYGIVAPAMESKSSSNANQATLQAGYDSYAGLDVTDKWVVIFRFVPEDITPELRQHLSYHGGLMRKAFYARERGAAGIIVVSGPNSQVRQSLVPLQNDSSPGGSSLAAVSVADEVVTNWLQPMQKNLTAVQTELDSGKPIAGFEFTDLKIGATIDVKKITGTGRNVVGRLLAGEQPSETAIVVGAHIDHLGLGKTGGSLAKEVEQGAVHFGADDNASGVAGMLEIAEYLVAQRRAGKLKLKRDVIFAGWSGEELGLHGSKHFADGLKVESPAAQGMQTDVEKPAASFHDFVLSIDSGGKILLNNEVANIEELEQSLAFIGKSVPDFVVEIEITNDLAADKLDSMKSLLSKHNIKNQKITIVEESDLQSTNAATDSAARPIAAALNMDMIGRMEDKLILQGIGSSDAWPAIIESKNAVVGLPLTLSADTSLPTDASSFYQAGVPILSAFTGSHTDYHTPRDTPEKLNYESAAKIARLMGLITRALATDEEVPNYLRQSVKPTTAARSGGRAYLGSVPSYGDDVLGVMLSDVTTGAPADVAGVKGGDIVVGLAGKKIENIEDYTAVISALKVGQEVEIIVERGDQRLTLRVTPGSRQ